MISDRLHLVLKYQVRYGREDFIETMAMAALELGKLAMTDVDNFWVYTAMAAVMTKIRRKL